MKKIGIIIGLLIVLGFAIAFYRDTSSYSNQYAIKDSLVMLPVKILAVDYSGQGVLSQKTILEGQGALLLIKKPPTGATLNYTFVTSLQEFASYDMNGDNLINLKDPAYSDLSFLYVNQKENTKKVISLEKAGVRAILLNSAAIKEVEAHPTEFSSEEVAQIFLYDGSRLPIKFILFDKSAIQTPQ